MQTAEAFVTDRLRWLGTPMFSVQALARNDVRLFLTSAALLFVELLLIRWIPANVTYIGFFTNFILMASFLGIGLGILLGRQGITLAISPFAPLLLAVVLLVYRAQLNVQLRSTNELFFGLAESTSADVNFLVLPLVVLLVVGVMASLALPLGPLFRSMPPLKAYAIDIGGSMAGIAVFTALSAQATNPALWFVVLSGVLLLLAVGRGLTPISALSGAAMGAVIVGTLIVNAGSTDIWSPYYRITLGNSGLSVNGIPHQSFRPLSELRSNYYDQVYLWFPEHRFDDVLVIGAGAGNDVAVHLRKGATHVDAVEIDPEIQRIGVQRHPEHPYQDARVAAYTNDGRAFLRNTDKKYDLIVFALTDSLTLVSTTANLRLESFLFTEQAFANARDHLKPDGVFVMYNFYRQGWVVGRLTKMAEEVFGHITFLLVSGDPKRLDAIRAKFAQHQNFWIHPKPLMNEAVNAF